MTYGSRLCIPGVQKLQFMEPPIMAAGFNDAVAVEPLFPRRQYQMIHIDGIDTAASQH